MRLKLDENLPFQLRLLFEESGHDVLTVLDQEIGGAKDSELASVCIGEDRVLITLDTDFADIRVYPPGNHPGIVVLRLGSQSRNNILEVGARLIGTLADSFSRGQLWIVEESRVRIRE